MALYSEAFINPAQTNRQKSSCYKKVKIHNKAMIATLSQLEFLYKYTHLFP